VIFRRSQNGSGLIFKTVPQLSQLKLTRSADRVAFGSAFDDSTGSTTTRSTGLLHFWHFPGMCGSSEIAGI
jgi:hypothetical protein